MLFLNILIAKHALLCNESIHPFSWSLLPARFSFLSGSFLTADKSLYFVKERGKEWPKDQCGLEVGCISQKKKKNNRKSEYLPQREENRSVCYSFTGPRKVNILILHAIVLCQYTSANIPGKSMHGPMTAELMFSLHDCLFKTIGMILGEISLPNTVFLKESR